MKKLFTAMLTTVCALCTIMISAMTASAADNTLVSQIVESNGKTFFMSDFSDTDSLIDEDISSLVREVKEIYKVSTATRTIVDMNQPIEELKRCLIDAACVSVKDVNYGAELVTEIGNDEYVFNFDMYSWPHEKRDNSWSWTFQYENFEYIVFENNSQLAITKIARPSDDAPSYNLILNYDEEYLSRFRNDLANCSDVHITTDMNFYPRVHVYIYKNDGTKVEYVLFYYNEKPLTEECEILGKVTAENELTFYYVDGFTCVDVAPLENIES